MNSLTIGIQGGKGSFSEAAAKVFAKNHGVNDFEIAYLISSKAVSKSTCSGGCSQLACPGGIVRPNPAGGAEKGSIFASSYCSLNRVCFFVAMLLSLGYLVILVS